MWAPHFCALELQGLRLGPGPGQQGVWVPSWRKLSSCVGLGVVLPPSESCALLPTFCSKPQPWPHLGAAQGLLLGSHCPASQPVKPGIKDPFSSLLCQNPACFLRSSPVGPGCPCACFSGVLAVCFIFSLDVCVFPVPG